MRKLVVIHAEKFATDIEKITRGAPGFTVQVARDKADYPKMLPGAEILLGWVDEAEELCLYEGTPLRFIQSYSTGVDDYPQEKLERYGVKLATASGVHARPVAETAFAMLLALVRDLPQAIRNMAGRGWERPVGYQNMDEVHGKTIGILGTGHIGREAARMAQGFGMRVLGLRRSGGAVEGFESIYTREHLYRLLGASDIVLNILPLTEETENLIDAAAFAAMRHGAVYIAVGRGKTTDTGALVNALMKGQVGAAGLDVTEPEPLPPESPLWGMPNVIVLPHFAGFSRYQMPRIVDLFCDNLVGYLENGSIPRNLVDYTLEY